MANVNIRLLTAMAGVDFSHAAGDEIALDAAAAKRLIENGDAEPVAKRATDKAEKRVSKTAEKR